MSTKHSDGGQGPWQVKRVDSSSGGPGLPGTCNREFINAVLSENSVRGETKVLWKYPNLTADQIPVVDRKNVDPIFQNLASEAERGQQRKLRRKRRKQRQQDDAGKTLILMR